MKNRRKPVFIYCLKHPETGDVRYIGQTTNLKKRFRSHLTGSAKKKNHLGNWLSSLLGPPVLAVLHEVAETESWQEEERRYISCARAMGVDLVNATDGGEGASGFVETPEQCAAKSARQKGVLRGPSSSETREAISASWTPERRAAKSAAQTGVPLPPKHCAAIGDSKRGTRRSPEQCAAMSAAHTGVPLSTEHCAAISAVKKGVPRSPEARAAISAGKMGVPMGLRSPEHCAALSAARKGVPWSEARRAAHERGKTTS